MISKLGEDKHVVKKVKKYLKQAFKNKYFKRGYKAADKGKSRSENPYTLTEECWNILRKRTYWDLGFEQRAYSKLPSDIRRKERQKAEDEKEKRKQEKRDERSREKWEAKAKKRRLKNKHKKRKHSNS